VRRAVRASQFVVELAQQTVDAVFELVDLQAVLLVEPTLINVFVIEGDAIDGQDSLEDPFRRRSARKVKSKISFSLLD
jgi:hypothetical protein